MAQTNYSLLGPTPGMINTQNKSAFSGLALNPTGGSMSTLSPQVSQVKSITPTTPQASSPFSGLGLNSQGQATINGAAQKGSTTVNGQPLGSPSLSNFYGIGGSNLQTGYGLIPSSQANPATLPNTVPAGTQLVNRQGQTVATSPDTKLVTPQNMTSNQQTAWDYAKSLIPTSSASGGGTGSGGTSGDTSGLQSGMIQIGGKYYKNGVETDANGNALSTSSNTTSTNTQNTDNQYSSTNPATFPGLINQLSNQASGPSQAYLDAQAEAQRVSDQAVKVSQDYAQKTNNIADTAGFLTQQTGLQGLLNTQYDTVENALASQYTGATNRLSAANTQQGLQQTGLTSAAGLTQPTYQSPGTSVFNPATGQFNPTIAGTQAGGVGLTGIGTMLGQMQGAQTAAAVGGTISAAQEQQKQQYISAHQQASNLVNQASDLMVKFNLNPSEINAANAGIQKIAQNISDPRYQQLLNYFQDIASRYAQILTPTGGSQTDTVRDTAQGMINSTASGQSIQQVFNGLDNQAQAVIAGVQTNQNNYGNTNSAAGWL